MTKVLVVDDERDIRELLVDELTDCGYETVQAANGAEALERVYADGPDILLLDLMMPVLDGIQVLRALKSNAHTASLPVVLLTAVSADEGEQRAMELGVNHYVIKPWEPGTIQTIIKVTLREVENGGQENSVDHAAASDVAGQKIESSAFVSTGDPQLDFELGGGVPREGLTFIEGAASTGKSVLCQHFAYAALVNGYSVSYFSSQHSPASMVGQMASLGLNPSKFYQEGQLVVTAIPTVTHSIDRTQALFNLARQVKDMAADFRFVIIDDLAGVTNRDEEGAIISFVSQVKTLGDSGDSIVVAAHPDGLSDDALIRVRSLSDGYLALRLEKNGSGLSKVLEVYKIANAEFVTGNQVSFEVEPGMGIRINAISKVNA